MNGTTTTACRNGPECCSRGFDILVDNIKIVQAYSPQVEQGGMTEENRPGAVVVYEFTAAASGVVSIELASTADDEAFADDNPILNAFTLEQLY